MVREFFDEVRLKKYSEKSKDLVKSKKPQAVIELLTPYIKDSSVHVRFFAMNICYQVSIENAASKKIRRQATDILVECCNDESTGNWQRACNLLMHFTEKDFSNKSKAAIRNLLKPGKITEEFILLSGVANLQDQKRRLYEVLKSAGNECGPVRFYGCNAWYAHLALARLGEDKSINYCIEKIEALQDIDRRIVSYMSKLDYIRQPQTFALLTKYLHSDERVSCESDHVPCTEYVQYVLPLLARSIEGFPVPIKDYYTDTEIVESRNWLKSHPKYKILK